MIILWTVLGAGSGHSVSDRNLNSHRENETPMSWLEMRAVWGKASLLEVPVMGGAWSGWSGRRVPGTRVEQCGPMLTIERSVVSPGNVIAKSLPTKDVLVTLQVWVIKDLT